MDTSFFVSAFSVLFKETFEGVAPGASGTWFVEGTQSLLEVFDLMTAEQASRRPSDQVASIGAHLKHTCYYLSQSNAAARKESLSYDWEGSWSQQAFTEEEWAALKVRLLKEYTEFLARVGELEDPEPGVATAVLANLAHAAFHLGAVRQLMRLVS